MGQSATRIMSYDQTMNKKNAIPALNFLGSNMNWYRLDDGVMGGRSETIHSRKQSEQNDENSTIHFKGTINTDGGGFTSIRSTLPSSGLPSNVKSLRVKYRGDGKTYKMLMSDGAKEKKSFFSRNTTWQIDLPTTKKEMGGANESECQDDNFYEEAILPIQKFQPSNWWKSSSAEENSTLNLSEIIEIGFMLSLKLSDGEPNPPETFGEGIFDFSLEIDSISTVFDS